MFNLGFDEPRVMLQTDSTRVVAIGRSGWRTDLRIEAAHKDALGEVSWHEVSRYDIDSRGNLIGDVEDGAAVVALCEALGKIRTLEAALDRAEQHIAGLEATP